MRRADAKSAYTQARLKGTPTWITLPWHQWPQKWKDLYHAGKLKRPVVPLILALYGHPQSGGFWEEHCAERIGTQGFKQICEEWPSCFFHEGLKLLLVIYVDDFKLSGPRDKLPEGWKLLSDVIDLDAPHDPDLYLGCVHRYHTIVLNNRTLLDYGV